MNDMSGVIQPKSDQVNADDFIPGPRTYTIEGVAGRGLIPTERRVEQEMFV